jgi:predicted peptidase
MRRRYDRTERTKKLGCCLVLAVVLGGARTSTGAADQTRPADDAEFEALQYKDAGGATLLYRLLKPGPTAPAQQSHPLLVFLHGAGERGSDNEAQLKHGKEMMLTAARKYGAFVLVPQCPAGEKWVDVDWGRSEQKMPEKPAQSLRLLVELIARLQKEYPIEADRLYVMGLSMGGYGTWDMIQRYPDMFAAAVPICGGGDETQAERIAKIPVWAFHGAKDTTVSVSRSRNMIQAIKAAGGEPKYTEYPDVGHFAWVPAFRDPEMLKWLFTQRRAVKK